MNWHDFAFLFVIVNLIRWKYEKKLDNENPYRDGICFNGRLFLFCYVQGTPSSLSREGKGDSDAMIHWGGNA
jgi:hypothetical protein